MHRLLLISRVCEEFGCLPSVAVRELERDPEHTAIDLIELRAYQQCKTAYDDSVDDRDDKLDPWRDSSLLDDVVRITHELYQERRPKTNFKANKPPAIVLTDAD